MPDYSRGGKKGNSSNFICICFCQEIVETVISNPVLSDPQSCLTANWFGVNSVFAHRQLTYRILQALLQKKAESPALCMVSGYNNY